MIARRRARIARLRRRVHFILDSGVNDHAARVAHGFLIALVIASVVAVVLETVPQLHERYQIVFDAIEFVALVGFSIEYALRIWSAPDSAPYFGLTPWRARLAYARTPYAIVDLLRNAFIRAIQPSIDREISIANVGRKSEEEKGFFKRLFEQEE